MDEARLLDAVKGALLASFAANVPADGVIDRLARAEAEVCEVYAAGSFQALASGMSFLGFCAASARQISPILRFNSGRGASDAVQTRLTEVLHLSLQPPDAERKALSHVKGVIERHFGVRLESLGYSSVDEIMDELQKAPTHDARFNGLVAASQSLLWHGKAQEETSKDGKLSEALSELKAAPFLLDLS